MHPFNLDYSTVKENTVVDRYVTIDAIDKFLFDHSHNLHFEVIGLSVQQKKIKMVTLGYGPKKILMWSQMHGNESTTTKAVLDLINYLSLPSVLADTILQECTVQIIPILNPDGAAAYTRINANEIDLNRDAHDRSQPESKVLRAIYDAFQPDFCFNLHDQRTIFNVGQENKPATISFLSPAHDQERSISKTRGVSMQLIVAMNSLIQQLIPGQVGRYDDSFNHNCVGDAFQMLNTPTILFEAGHFPGDYSREKTREYIFYAMLKGLETIARAEIPLYPQDHYFEIPENGKLYFDVLIKNAHLLLASQTKRMDIGVLYKEVLESTAIKFQPFVEKTGDLHQFYGHKTYDCLDENDLKSIKLNKKVMDCLG
ncbi:M14 family metallopeptidase [Sediminicola sp. 1XM1-17]|uniref:M14 family metallopeptidase n=1 Tax=Sediminicola sp. 1XM1-17 TaxID=3127702 RepID=UPI0030774D33